MEPPPLPDKPSVGQILHIDQEDALRLTGSLMNEFTREIIQVFILKFIIGQVSTAGSTPLNRKIGHPLRKMTNPLKKQRNRFEKLRIRRSSLFVACFHQSESCKGQPLITLFDVSGHRRPSQLLHFTPCLLSSRMSQWIIHQCISGGGWLTTFAATFKLSG